MGTSTKKKSENLHSALINRSAMTAVLCAAICRSRHSLHSDVSLGVWTVFGPSFPPIFSILMYTPRYYRYYPCTRRNITIAVNDVNMWQIMDIFLWQYWRRVRSIATTRRHHARRRVVTARAIVTDGLLPRPRTRYTRQWYRVQ